MVTIPDGYGQISLVHTGANMIGEGVITIGFENTTDDDAQGIADNFKSALIAADYTDHLDTLTVVEEVRVKLGPSSTGPSAISSVGLNGGVGGQPVPPNVALLISKVTPLGGRRGRGRLYVPGMPMASLDDTNNWDTDVAQNVADTIGAIMDAMAFLGQSPRLLHDGALTPTPITSWVGQDRIATQRRRNRR